MWQSLQDITVVICAYTENRWDELLAAVESVRSQTVQAREIIVVVDHNPGLLARIREHLADVIGIENKEQRGLSGARNSGIAAAHGDAIAFLDDDAVARPDWLAQLLSQYADSKVLGVGGSIVPMWLAGRPRWFPEEFNWVVGCTYQGMPQVAAPVRNLIGCNMSFRREVFEAVGGFRSEIGRIGTRPLGCEETEFCIRVNQRWPQVKLLYDPRACVYHRVPRSRTRWSYFFSRCYSEGLSKAIVSHIVGAGDGLSSERSYALRTLPHGVMRGFVVTFRHRNLMGLVSAVAIVAGLALTTTGYIVGVCAQRFAMHRERPVRESAVVENPLQ